MACQYEQIWSERKDLNVGTFNPNTDEVTETTYSVPKSQKYYVTIPYNEVKKIQEEYKDAVKQFCDYINNAPIYSIGK